MSTASRPGSDEPIPRRMWRVLEPYHAVVYFAPESRAATDELGCRGGWMSYFALRAAPLGPAGADVVTALFYNFHPARVAKAIPAAWEAASPQEFLDARLAAVDARLRRACGDALDAAGTAEAAELARIAAEAAPTAGRALAAANAALDWPDAPHLVLWAAQTLLRESRGDGHVAALVSAGLDPCEALVAFAAEGRTDPGHLRSWRGWSEDEWVDAERRLRERGLLDDAGALSAEGRELRRWVEQRTDDGALAPWHELGARHTERLVELAMPIVGAVLGDDGLMQPNPMGLVPATA